MPIDEPQAIEVQLNDLAHVFAKGNRMRIAISTSYWPMAWPSPQPVTLAVHTAECELLLPRRPARDQDDELPPFPPPMTGPEAAYTDVHEGGVRRSTDRDAATGQVRLQVEMDLETDGTPSLTLLDDIELETGHGMRETFVVHPDDPLSARVEVLHRTLARRGEHAVRAELRTSLHADHDTFHFTADLIVHEGPAEVAHRQWRERVPRPTPSSAYVAISGRQRAGPGGGRPLDRPDPELRNPAGLPGTDPCTNAVLERGGHSRLMPD